MAESSSLITDGVADISAHMSKDQRGVERAVSETDGCQVRPGLTAQVNPHYGDLILDAMQSDSSLIQVFVHNSPIPHETAR